MTDQQAKNLLYDTARTLRDGGKEFKLILQTGDTFFIVDRQPDGCRFLNDVTRFKIYHNSAAICFNYKIAAPKFEIISGTVKSLGSSTVTLNCGGDSCTVWFLFGANSYIDNIRNGDFLKLRVVKTDDSFQLDNPDDVIFHQRTTVLKG